MRMERIGTLELVYADMGKEWTFRPGAWSMDLGGTFRGCGDGSGPEPRALGTGRAFFP